MNKNKVFVGPINTAGNAKYIAYALKEAGIIAKSFSFKEHPFGYKADNDNILFHYKGKRTLLCKFIINKYSLQIIHLLQRLTLFFKCLFKYNTFIFISPHTFLKSNIDLPILKLFEKKVAFFFPGCTERNPLDIINKKDNAICAICNDIGKQKYCLCHNQTKKQKKIQYFEKYSQNIFARRNTINLLKDKKYHQIYLTSDIIIDKSILNKFNNSPIKICHFPSNRNLKASNIILKVLEQAKDLYGNRIEILSEKIPNKELVRELQSTHILIDHLSGGGYGLLGIEGMANGCVVVAKMAEWFIEDYPDVPIINTNKKNLKKTIFLLVENSERMEKIGKKGIEYYQKYHTPEAVGNYYKKTLQLT